MGFKLGKAVKDLQKEFDDLRARYVTAMQKNRITFDIVLTKGLQTQAYAKTYREFGKGDSA